MGALLVALALLLLPAVVSAQVCTVEDEGAGYVDAASTSVADVQAAIGAAGSTGKTVCVPAGTIAITGSDRLTNCYIGSTPTYSGLSCTGRWVHIRGAGTMPLYGAATSGGTTIDDQGFINSNSTSFYFAESPDGNASISNFTVTMYEAYKKANAGTFYWDKGAGTVAIGTSGAKVLIMHHMTFNDGGESSQIWRQGMDRGVIYRNKFLRSRGENGQATHRIVGGAGSAPRTYYETVATHGSADANGDLHLYFENNIINNYAQMGRDTATRNVIRFNTGENWAVSGHGRDTGDPSVRYIEVYKNTFQCRGDGTDSRMTTWGGVRGGVQYWFLNTMDQITGAIAGDDTTCVVGNINTRAADVLAQIWMLQDRPNTACYLDSSGNLHAYPAPQQFGWGWKNQTHTVINDRYCYSVAAPGTTFGLENNSGQCTGGTPRTYTQDLEGSYIWLNYRPDGTTKINSSTTNTPVNDGGFSVLDKTDTCAFGALQSTYIQEDREWFKQKDSFDGTSGIGVGTRASRPASTTNGVGWWATDQGGNWDTTNGTSNDGCLDMVQSGAWVNCAYTPFTYPHPLATVTGSEEGGGGGGDSGISGSLAPRGRPRWHGPHAKPDRLETP